MITQNTIEKNDIFELIDILQKNSILRRKFAEKNNLTFALSYLSHYIQTDFAPFHIELSKNIDKKLVIFIGFRGCAKSTLITTAEVIREAIFKPASFIVLVSATENLSSQHAYNIKTELEENIYLKNDFPFLNEIREIRIGKVWRLNDFVLGNKSRIKAVSVGEKVRGLRHLRKRPNLIVLDDVETIETVISPIQRQKTIEHFFHEIYPLQDLGAKILIVGNYLHEEGLIGKLISAYEQKQLPNAYLLKVPILDKNNQPTWEARFNEEKIKEIKNFYEVNGQLDVFYREFLLETITRSSSFFYEFNKDIHIIRPFDIPEFWRRFICLDYGDTSPSAVYWIAIAPEGRLYVYRELYGSGFKYSDLARKIFNLTDKNEKIDYIVADDSIFAKTGYEKSGADIMAREFSIVNWRVPILKANKDRINGWRIFKQFLAQKKIFFFENCENLIRTLPLLVYDRFKTDDIDSHQEDHCADAIRYGIMSFYGETREEKPQTPTEELWRIIKEDIKRTTEEWKPF